MKLDHICFAVKDLKEAIDYWGKVFGYRQLTQIIENTRQKVKVTFLSKDGSINIKLIEPVNDNQSLINFVNRGGGFHHICFICDNIDEAMVDLTEKGLLTLVPPQPGEAFNDHMIAFLLGRNGVNIELIDTEEKAGLIPNSSIG
jgi:methylmalonyl-CoA/ethylmalonyl-CoA epimerase